jgi:two-component system OmpR family sensor kinase
MRRAPSALLAIGGFGVAVAAMSVATTAAIVLAAPPPPALRTTATDALSALRAPKEGFRRRTASTPPGGPRIIVIERLIAKQLGKPDGDVRVTRLDTTPPAELSFPALSQSASGTAVFPINGAAAVGKLVLPNGEAREIRVLAPEAVDDAMARVLLNVPLPAYATSVRQGNGSWLVAEPVRPFLGGWQVSIMLALSVSLLLLAPLAWIFARRLTRPFRALASALQNDAGEVPQAGPRELREAAAAIAAMQRRLAEESKERARMLSAIAHDLRTPLTGLRLRIETTPEPQRSRMVADVGRMQAMIDEVLSFARDAATARTQFQVRPLLEEIVEELGAPSDRIRLRPGDDAAIYVSRPAFRRAVENLLRNALDYAGGGTIALERSADFVEVSVRDEGPGIPAADRERLLRPFERGEASRSRETGGAGLGLSIVADFAAQNRGTFALSGGEEGGTVATIRLPAVKAV